MIEINEISINIFVAFLVNLAAGWFIGAFVAGSFYVLIIDLFATTMCLYLAIRLEGYIKNAKL